jgi:nucleotide-binding universal stress UspA family protein
MQPLDTSKPARFQNVLLATDFSPASESALLYSLALARRWGARIIVAHVVNPSAIFGQDSVQRAVNDAWREAHTEMTNQLIAGRLEGVENHVVVRQGDVWEQIEKMIGEFRADLLVTGTRGRSGVWKMLLGSTAEKIFRLSPIPVLSVGPKSPEQAPTEGPKRILFSTGFARHSLYAGAFALWLAEHNQAQLAMLNVISGVSSESQAREQLRHEGRQKLHDLIPPAAQLPCPPELFVEFGPAAEAILKIADQWRPDLIVLGLRRHTEEGRRLSGATAYNVVCNAPCPVLTVKAQENI